MIFPLSIPRSFVATRTPETMVYNSSIPLSRRSKGTSVSWSRTLKVRQMLRGQIEAGEEIALLFSDLRGFSSYAMRQGDQAAFRLAQRHEDIVRTRVSEYGIVVKSLGDGVMSAFEAPLPAILAATSIQRTLREENALPSSEPIDIGIGISTGTPVMTDIDFIGHAVNLAQRLSSLAKGGQILTTGRVYDSTPLPQGMRFVPLGERSLRGIGIETIVEVVWLSERVRVSDAQDLITLVLTERGTVVVERARDTRQEARDALARLFDVDPRDAGYAAAAMQKLAAGLALRLLRRSGRTPNVARELDVADLRVERRGGGLDVRTPAGVLRLRGVAPGTGDRFAHAVREMQAAKAVERSARA